MSAVVGTTFLPILMYLRLVVELWANIHQTDITLTFDLSTSKWDHGLSMSCASFLPIFSFLCPSVLDLGSGTGQTDRQTDEPTDNGHQRLLPPPYGGGDITNEATQCVCELRSEQYWTTRVAY